jgi:hypothetical protein
MEWLLFFITNHALWYKALSELKYIKDVGLLVLILNGHE